MKKKFTSSFTGISENHNNMINERISEAKQSLGINSEIMTLDCNLIDTWEYRDRKYFELGNIDELANSIKTKGQVQPIIIVRKDNVFQPKNANSGAEYIVIAGHRRWLACKNNNIKIKAILEKLNFKSAVAYLVAENEKENVSDYSKGLFYSNILKSDKITQEEISEKLGLSQSSLNRFLSFDRVDNKIWNAVDDISKVSARTSSEIASLSNKGQNYIDAIISIADKIRAGAGEKTIKKEVDNIINGSIDISSNDKYFYSTGKEAFRSDKNKIEIKTNKLSDKQREKLTKLIKENLEKYTKDNINSF